MPVSRVQAKAQEDLSKVKDELASMTDSEVPAVSSADWFCSTWTCHLWPGLRLSRWFWCHEAGESSRGAVKDQRRAGRRESGRGAVRVAFYALLCCFLGV